MGRGTWFTTIVKSSFVSPRIGRRFLSSTRTVTRATSTPERKAGGGCCCGARTNAAAASTRNGTRTDRTALQESRFRPGGRTGAMAGGNDDHMLALARMREAGHAPSPLSVVLVGHDLS